MRIVHVITRLILGGAQENTLLTVDGLHHTFGDDVTLITGPAEGPEGDLFTRARERHLNVEVMPELVRAIDPGVDYRAYRALRKAIRRLQPEVVHTHSSKAGILGRAAAWHERRCHAIVGVCDAMADQALDAGVGVREQYSTVYSGMDVDTFLNPKRSRESVRQELGLADQDVAFGTVARLFERKGHDDILAVAHEVLRRNPNVRFVFIGDGILRDRLVRETERLGVAHAFRFTGLVPPDQIPELLHGLDAVVHPSLREGLARVLPQALLVERPVISYDIDGAREVVLPETGILLAPRDLEGLTAAILRLAGDDQLRARMGQEGRYRFAHQFRHETMTAQLRSLYERVLAGSGHA
jgi:glycosyltransferase involved in cell wall biosynthesis